MIIVKFRTSIISQESPRDYNSSFLASIEDWRLAQQPCVWNPPTDLMETEEKWVVRTEIAGMNEGDFNIILERSLLTISGMRPDSSINHTFQQMEIRFGEFFVQVEIPGTFDPEQVHADYRDGFLTIDIPKYHPRRIVVVSDAQD